MTQIMKEENQKLQALLVSKIDDMKHPVQRRVVSMRRRVSRYYVKGKTGSMVKRTLNLPHDTILILFYTFKKS